MVQLVYEFTLLKHIVFLINLANSQIKYCNGILSYTYGYAEGIISFSQIFSESIR